MESWASAWRKSEPSDEPMHLALPDRLRLQRGRRPAMSVGAVSHGAMHKHRRPPLQRAVLTGVVLGLIGIYLASVGILLMIHGREIIVDVLTLGQAALLAIAL